VKYAKADEVLPAELVEEIRKHCTGMIYVKSDRRFYKERYREVMRLHGQGLSTKDIAERVHLCARRVLQIIKAQKQARPECSRGRRTTRAHAARRTR
jgi:DNA-binding NarL/FixJ family response regulator